ncbi:hypothetical protein Tsubulata_018815 [Turnera subulata]|uniref:Filament-like plant protein n=1 Tax=Turnera subulata TaxID=218843 RepID=A0A9Q0FKA9_9ROSI|nr:hypothetical protein Tsubulata_018815 [Turnera subulata]
MEKRKWLWKRKPSERSPGETESSGSISSQSERFSDDQDISKTSPINNSQSPEVTSKSVTSNEDVNDNIKNLTERLSAALVNVSAKDDLVKQHAKVAEEAVAGWEKAENEVVALRKQLEASIKQNAALDDRVSHLDGALKECVRQLRQAREEQEEKIREAMETKTHEWESTKSELENQIVELNRKAEAVNSESHAEVDLDLLHKLEHLEQENSTLRLRLLAQSEELEVRTIERDLSTQAAETASKQHLESIKKVTRLEAECRRLKSCKSYSLIDQKISASSTFVESLTDSQSDSGEKLNTVELDTRKMSCSEPLKCETSCSDSWASALIAELDLFKNEKVVKRNLPATSIEIDLMDDFLEMERLAALPDNGTESGQPEPEAVAKQSNDVERSLRAELDTMIQGTAELEGKLQKMEGEKVELEEKLEKMQVEIDELEMALNKSKEENEASQLQLRESQKILEELQSELSRANETKKQIESQVISMEAEARTMSAKVQLLEEEVEKERVLSKETAEKCEELEKELAKKKEEIELQQTAISNSEPKIKQEDIDVAARKLADCQKTIASLGKQLRSLATLEDFLIDTASIPDFSAGGSVVPRANGEPWKLHSNQTYSPKLDSESSRIASESPAPLGNKNEGNSPSSSPSTSSALSLNQNSDKNRNGFAKFFSRSKNGLHLEI